MLSSSLPGGHSGLCQSLQCHLRLLGIRLPAGSYLPDTSLLLGRHQSQLPREQLPLVRARLGTAWHGWNNKPPPPPPLVFSSCSDLEQGNVQRSGTLQDVWIATSWGEVNVRMLDICVVIVFLSVMFWEFWFAEQTLCRSVRSWFTRTQIQPGFCTNLQKFWIKDLYDNVWIDSINPEMWFYFMRYWKWMPWINFNPMISDK